MLVLGSTNPQPHILTIKGYPPKLTVIDFMELAEVCILYQSFKKKAGRVFSRIDLMPEIKWNLMVCRLRGEPAPFKLTEEFFVAKDAQIVIEPKEYVKLNVYLPGRKKALPLYNVPKIFSVKDLKLALLIRYDLYFSLFENLASRPIGENRGIQSGMYRSSDETFSNPFRNDSTLYQLDLNAGESVVFNLPASVIQEMRV